MRPIKNFFSIVVICAVGVLLQSCWKDKTLKDKGPNVRLNISPTYGIPLMDITIKGEDVVKRINKDSSTKHFYIEYNAKDYDLCVIVYDKTNIPVVLSSDSTTTNKVVSYPLSFFADLRKNEGWTPMVAYALLYVDNYYATNFDFNLKKLDYENQDGIKKSIVSSGTLPRTGRVYAAINGTPTRTLAVDTLTIHNPYDIVFKGEMAFVDFSVISATPPNDDGKLNLNPRIKVPAHIIADNFVRRDTVAASLEGISKYADDPTVTVEKVTMFVKAINSLPLDANVQIYFVDKDYRTIDSIRAEDIFVKAGIVNPSTYLIQTPIITEEKIDIPNEKIKRLEDTRYLIIRERFTSWEEASKIYKDVKLFKSNYMNVILSVKLDTRINGTISEINESISNYDKK
jgi:hypothetical protein